MLRWLVCSLALIVVAPLMAQEGPVPPVSVPFGMREIDKLPRSQYARPLFGEPSWLWSAETEPQAPEVTVHTKASYRVGLRRMERLGNEIEAKHAVLAAHDQSDFAGLGRLGDELRSLESEVAAKEARWLELSDLLGA